MGSQYFLARDPCPAPSETRLTQAHDAGAAGAACRGRGKDPGVVSWVLAVRELGAGGVGAELSGMLLPGGHRPGLDFLRRLPAVQCSRVSELGAFGPRAGVQ